MRSFCKMTRIFIKRQLLRKAFLLCSMMFLGLFAAFALLCPENQPLSAKIGISFEKSESELDSAFSPLFDSTDIRFVYYSPDEIDMMKRDILLGRLHCGYLISSESEIPITVFENDGSILTPATDEIVFSAWFTAGIGDIAPTLCGSRYAAFIAESVRQQTAKPLSITVKTAEPSIENTDYSTVSPLIYAVSISMSICCAAFCGVFSPKEEKNTLALLCLNHNRTRVSASMAFSQAILYFSLLILGEVILLLLGTAIPYSLFARILANVITAVFCAAASHIFAIIAPRPLILFGVMLWSVGSVLLSGAIFAPELLGNMSWLKFLSPAWFILKFMTALS